MTIKTKMIFAHHTDVSLSETLVGYKAKNLQKFSQISGISTPAWFVLSTTSFKQFLSDHDLFKLIEKLNRLCLNFERHAMEIEEMIKEIKRKIFNGKLNEKTLSEIHIGYQKLREEGKHSNPHFAVRSSSIIEDSASSSCAGLYDTILNCKNLENVMDAIKHVWASSFHPLVVKQRTKTGLKQADCLMGVIVQEMVHAQTSGVVSTIVLSHNYPGIQIAANYGLGESVASGAVSVDSWVVHPELGYILERIKGSKEIQMLPDVKIGGIVKTQVPQEMRNNFSLTLSEVHSLARQVQAIKESYGLEIDVEFAYDEHRTLYILQARPLAQVQSSSIQVVDQQCIKYHQALVKGRYSIPGVASGNLLFIRSLEELSSGKVQPTSEDIVAAYITTNAWTQYLGNIKGLITQEGAPASHPILLAREKNIPCVIGIDENFETLIHLNRQAVTIDGINRVIYQGTLPIKGATQEDLAKQFETVNIREWPNLEASLPHLLHNKMVVQESGKYWRRTPTYPVSGFQRELNLARFDKIQEIIENSDVRIRAKVIDGYTCCEMTSFEEYVGLFEGFDIERAERLNAAQQRCMDAFIETAASFEINPSHWDRYLELYATFRAFIWLGDAYRSYANRKVDTRAIAIKLPSFYLDALSKEVQSSIFEIDTQMHEDLYSLAHQLKDKNLPETLDAMRVQDKTAYDAIIKLSKKYRFEHAISLDKEIDLKAVYQRVKQEVIAIQSGAIFVTDKKNIQERSFLPEEPELVKWVYLSIWNRILQSNAHQLDARARATVRPILMQFGKKLVSKGILETPEKLFDLDRVMLRNCMEEWGD